MFDRLLTPLHARAPKKPKVQTIANRSNAIDLTAGLPPLLSPDSSAAQDLSSLDFLEQDPGQILAPEGAPSSISDTVTYPIPHEASGGTTVPILESAMAAFPQDSVPFVHGPHDQDMIFADFEEFTQNLYDQSLSPGVPSVESGGQPTTTTNLNTPELCPTESNDSGYSCASPIPWVANWAGRHLGESAASIFTEILLAPETVDSLLRDYFRFVNPTFPVVSEWDVYRLTHPDEIHEGKRVPPMSLALFNAIIFAASAFASREMARAAGFPNIRAMREAFHARAKVLYEAGCEGNLMNQIRICLLLSQRRKYPDGMLDNEKWVARAQNLFQRADTSHLQPRTSTRWKLLSCCCVIRAQRLIIGTHRKTLVTEIPSKLPQVTSADLEEDLRFPWFLSVADKRKLAQVFIAALDLQQYIDPLCQIVLRREPEPCSGRKGPGSIIPIRRSVMGELEEVESSLVSWRARYDGLLLEDWDATLTSGPASRPYFAVAAAHLNLGYEYCISSLHQISLGFETSSTTIWAARMRESSREALQESAASTTRILGELLDHDAVKFLPFAVIAMLFVPMTIHSVYLKSSVKSSARTLYDLSVCFRALEILAERHEVADFFWELNNASVLLVHEQLAKDDRLRYPGVLADIKSNKLTLSGGEPAKVPLPNTNTYSSVLRCTVIREAAYG
ncbi:hypothetical protein LTR70_005402 [Exophiala xenobiotica]|uniref:Transcription factor domain-containing protein n=1 Tax=Lithohypha guttulata TaxID=1690604 RepID=A0ABR0JUM6_9EURO|nr:hypothetical protein LTR24_010193 [Lithohypha guttulata]KAK5318488.1 hypothetical protein LTR70_005402 [Exophiala xenobiotica]